MFRKLSITSALVALSMLSFTAAAATVRVDCEKRSNRSRISVDGDNLAPGTYRAVALSGNATSASTFEPAKGDQAEFDFDSNPADIAEGATAISAAFIVNGRVRGYIVNAGNQRVTPIVEAVCRVRR